MIPSLTLPLAAVCLVQFWFIPLKSEELTVHVIPHSHCDPGYRETFNEYYNNKVHKIITTVIQALQEDTSRRFIWEEVSFFSVWWNQQSETMKNVVKALTVKGQLEFTGGGWMTFGLDFLKRELNVRPRVGWHIDPFGASIFTPTLYALLGYDAMIINRIPDPIKQDMKLNKQLEFIWRSHRSLPENQTSIFTHVLDSHYSEPHILGLDVEERARFLADICYQRGKYFATPHLLLPFGSDFTFINATEEFEPMDDYIQYINSHEEFNMKMQYSTLSEYADAVQATNTTFPSLYLGSDMFPYVACSPCLSEQCAGVPCGSSDCFWSGFYTSKPDQKLSSRKQDASLRSIEVLFSSMSRDPNSTINSVLDVVNLGRNTSALLQHHDALPGTSFPNCYDDYSNQLNKATMLAQLSHSQLIMDQLCGASMSLLQPPTVDAVNVLSIGLKKIGDTVVMLVYNSLEMQREEPVVIKDIPSALCIEAVNHSSQIADNNLHILLHVGPLSATAVVLERVSCTRSSAQSAILHGNFSLNNGKIRLDFDGSQRLYQWTNGSSLRQHMVSHSFQRYEEQDSLFGTFTKGNVYTFMPERGSSPKDYNTPKPNSTLLTANGPLVWEVTQTFEPSYLYHTYRLYANRSVIDMETRIGTLPIFPRGSYISRVTTDINSGPLFTTIDNGFQTMERIFDDNKSVQANTYPLTGWASLADSNTSMTWISMRPVAVFAHNGSMNLMLHRRLEGLWDRRENDKSIMQDTMKLVLQSRQDGPVNIQHSSLKLQYPLSVYWVLDNATTWQNHCQMTWQSMAEPLHQSIHLVSMQVREVTANGRQVGIRLHHMNMTSKSVSVDLQTLLEDWKITRVRETTIDFNVLKDMEMPHGNTIFGSTEPVVTSVTLNPMSLKAYLVDVIRP